VQLRQLRQFIVLAKAGNFHRAAEILNISQPPLSVSIRKLEDELGVELFERHARGVTLTAEGELAISQAREIVRLSDELISFAQDAQSGVRGNLNLGFASSAAYDLIPTLVPIFRERFPLIDLRLAEATSVAIIEGVMNGDLDVGLVRTPIFGVEGISLTPLASENMVLAVPRGHRLESRAEIDLAELENEPLIMWSRDAEPWFRTLIEMNFNAIDVLPKIAEEAAQIHTVLALVECGIGVALVPSVVRRSGSGRVRLVDLLSNGAPIEIGFALAVRAGSARRITSNFSDTAIEVFRNPDLHPLQPQSNC
jgi:DNA-binding transcriptional LysR family regulator